LKFIYFNSQEISCVRDCLARNHYKYNRNIGNDLKPPFFYNNTIKDGDLVLKLLKLNLEIEEG